MGIGIARRGVLKMFQGDTGDIIIDGIPDDENYYVYLAIRKKDGTLVFDELMQESNYQDELYFEISKELSDKLTVKPNQMCELYYWGVKICHPESKKEDMIFIGNNGFGRKINYMFIQKLLRV